MKQIMIGITLLINAPCIAQSCSKNSPLFTINSSSVGYGKEVTTLGSNPEFPFLRNKASAEQVYAAIKRNERNNGEGHMAFNNLMMDIGFANGVQDLTPASIVETRIPYGTEGNMGSGGYTYSYVKLEADGSGTRAWKISSGADCYVYFLAKCGNAFYASPGAKKMACLDVPVSVSATSKELTLNGATNVTTDNQYVYYHRRRQPKRSLAPEFADVPDPNSSNPVLVNTTKNTQVIPQTYTLTVNSPEDHVTVCPDSMLNLAANINVEKQTAYTGYYPAKGTKNYKEVSKHHYKKIARKMRKTKKKEMKVAKITGTPVEVLVKG